MQMASDVNQRLYFFHGSDGWRQQHVLRKAVTDVLEAAQSSKPSFAFACLILGK